MCRYELVLTGLSLISPAINPSLINFGINTTALAQSGARACAHPATLAATKDCYRPLILFAPSVHDPRAVRQLSLLTRHELEERDVLLIFLPAAKSDMNINLPSAVFSAEEGRQLRQRFKIGSEEFAVILIGKDGAEKLRREMPISGAELNSTIDAMPMRRREISGTLPNPSP